MLRMNSKLDLSSRYAECSQESFASPVHRATTTVPMMKDTASCSRTMRTRTASEEKEASIASVVSAGALNPNMPLNAALFFWVVRESPALPTLSPLANKVLTPPLPIEL